METAESRRVNQLDPRSLPPSQTRTRTLAYKWTWLLHATRHNAVASYVIVALSALARHALPTNSGNCDWPGPFVNVSTKLMPSVLGVSCTPAASSTRYVSVRVVHAAHFPSSSIAPVQSGPIRGPLRAPRVGTLVGTSISTLWQLFGISSTCADGWNENPWTVGPCYFRQ